MRQVICDGKPYRSITDAAKAIGVRSQEIHRALKRGWKIRGLSISIHEPQVLHSDKEGI